MKHIYILIILLLFSLINTFSQNIDFIDYSFPTHLKSATSYSTDYDFYNNLNTWIPRMGSLPLQNSPVKVIQINFNVFSKGDGSGNFPNSPDGRQTLITTFLNSINSIYNPIGITSDPYSWVIDLPNNDSRIRFDLGTVGNERIYFYNSDILYGSVNETSLKNAVIAADPNRMSQLNVYFVEGNIQMHVDPNITVTNQGSGYTSPPTVVFNPPGPQATAQLTYGYVTSITLNKDASGHYIGGSYSGRRDQVINITLQGGGGSGATATCFLSGGGNGKGIFPDFYDMNSISNVMLYENYSGYRTGQVLAHEFGHDFDLAHTFGDEPCSGTDYLSDLYGLTSPGVCPFLNNGWITDPFAVNGDRITNNMMNYGPPNFTYFSPMQAGKIHRALALSSVRKYVLETYSSVPYVLTKSETWDFSIRMYQDIVINSGITLDLKSNLVMPTLGKIIVNAGGNLTLESNINTNFSQAWQGIQINNGGLVELHTCNINNFPITVMSGGTLMIPASVSVNVNNYGKIEVNNGGYICINSSATLNLQDFNYNSLNLYSGFQFGVNTSYVPNPGNCLNSISSINKTGNGTINLFSTDVYIQNISISTNKYYSGNNISAGYNVTSGTPGNVVIQNGANVVIDANGNILLDKGFSVQLGASFITK